VLKHQLNVGKKLDKVWQFIEQIDLISSNNGETFNKQLLNFSQKYQVSKEKNAKRISEWRENQAVSENVTRSEHVSNVDKVKESKVNKEKESKEDFNALLMPFANDLGPEYMNFALYWTEKNNKGKERWECEKFFDISRRVKTWMTNNSKFKNNGATTNEPKLGTSAARMEAIKNW
jgi:hypothetical protein